MSEDFDIFAKLNDLHKNLAEQAQLALQNVDDISDTSMNFTLSETPEPKVNKKKKEKVKKAPKNTAEKNIVEINTPLESTIISDTSNQIEPLTRMRTRRNRKLSSNELTSSNLPSDNSLMDLFGSFTTDLRRRSRRVTSARRNYYNNVAARSSDIQYVDLVTSPLPPSNEVIQLDSDPENDTKSYPAKSVLETFDDDNPEMLIQFIWNGGYETHTLRKYQKFTHVFKILAERENTDVENLIFNIDSRIIFPDDTPSSIDYKVYQFIKGRVLSTKIDTLYKQNKQLKKDENTLTLKVQSDQWKHPKLMQMLKTEKFRIFIIKLAEELNIAANKIRLRFDEGIIDPQTTPEEMDMENGDIIDLLRNM